MAIQDLFSVAQAPVVISSIFPQDIFVLGNHHYNNLIIVTNDVASFNSIYELTKECCVDVNNNQLFDVVRQLRIDSYEKRPDFISRKILIAGNNTSNQAILETNQVANLLECYLLYPPLSFPTFKDYFNKENTKGIDAFLFQVHEIKYCLDDKHYQQRHQVIHARAYPNAHSNFNLNYYKR